MTTHARIALTGALVSSLLLLVAGCAARPAEGASVSTPSSGAYARATMAAASIDWNAVDSAIGRRGTAEAGGVHRYGMPRGDLAVTVHGVRVRPALSLGSWIAMLPVGDSVLAMGDLVLRDDEIGPVIDALRQGGVMQTALHNHLLDDAPHVMYLHVHGTGDPVAIARAVRAALERTGTPRAAGGAAPRDTARLDLDTAAIARVLGRGGSAGGGVYKVSVPRPEVIRVGGVVVPPSMGTATAIGIQPTGGGRAVTNGDFVLAPGEVNDVIAALRAHGIEVTAVHNHLLTEEPRLVFLHFWGDDDALALARGLRAALDRTAAGRAR